MTSFTRFVAAAAALGCIAVPAAAQYSQFPLPFPQPYPQQPYPQQTYPGYGYEQGYSQNPVTQIIDQLLGNRYTVTDRTAVSQCASAAMAQASAQYGGYGYQQGYNGAYNNGYGYNRASPFHVTSITEVEQRNNGLRVSGLMSSGYGGQYDGQYGYPYGGYGTELSFRCNVDYHGAVTNIRIRQHNNYRRY
jgi:hypothetical protein